MQDKPKERPPKRARKRRPWWCRMVLTRDKLLLICTISIYYLLFPPPLVKSTSNINSVWWPANELSTPNGNNNHSSSSRQHPTIPKRANITLDESVTNERGPSGPKPGNYDWPAAVNLQAASSSLQPAIVAMDGPSQVSSASFQRKQGERRSDSESGGWSAGATKQGNAQVQFDEEHQHSSSGVQSRNAYLVQGHSNDTALDEPLRPVNPLFHYDSLATDREQPARSNRSDIISAGQQASRASLPGGLSLDMPSNGSQSSNSAANYLYYLPNGDRWNSEEFNENSSPVIEPTSGQRRKLHNSGTQYYQSEQTEAMPGGYVLPIDSSSSSAGRHSMTPFDYGFSPVPFTASMSPAPFTFASLAAPTARPAHVMASLNHQIGRQRLDFESAKLFPVTPRRKQFANEHQMDGRLGAGLHRSIVRQHLVGKPAKQKKSSLLSNVLGGRFNHWSESLPKSNNYSHNRALEHSFYSGQMRGPNHMSWPPPPSGTASNSANYYQLDAANAGPAPAFALLPSMPPLGYYGSASQLIYRPASAPVSQPRARPRRPSSSQAAETRPRASQVANDKLAQPASFIPVVAVSVTKTSPAPKAGSPGEVGPEADGSELGAGTNELDEYLAQKTGYRPAKQKQEEYGNLASGSTSSLSGADRQRATSGQRNSKLNERGPEHTTTVKSTVFGYLPQQANEPILQALQALNQDVLPELPVVPPVTQQRPPSRNQNKQRSVAADFYSPAASALDHTHASHEPLSVWPEEPPSLTLQLQANNFLHNDIAHPFGDAHKHLQRGPAAGQLYSGSPSGGPLEVFPTDSQYHGFQFNAASALHPVDGSGLLGSAATPTHLLASAPSDYNPLLGQLIYAGSAGAPQFAQARPPHQQSRRPAKTTPASDNDEPESDESEPHQQVSSKGRKRSSEFFANAGQLLLSALPLLLAPTLGLMFAASPNPIARYHAPFDSGRPSLAAGGSEGALHTSLPSGYINGVVSNASPSPLLFTPTPPISTSAAPTASPSSGPSSPSSSPGPRANQSSAALSPKRETPHSSSASPTRMTFLVTTVGPHEHIARSNALNASGELQLGHSNESTILSNQTIVVVSPEPTSGWASSVSENATSRKNNHYDTIGYEGADFDAQFPSLRRPENRKPVTEAPETHIFTTLLPADRNLLYPVSTWPPLRRRTVSLVTSNGNKTLFDASEKYGAQLAQQTDRLLRNQSGMRNWPNAFRSAIVSVDDSVLRRSKRAAKADEKRRVVRVIRRVKARKSDPSFNATNLLDQAQSAPPSDLVHFREQEELRQSLNSDDQMNGDSSRSKPAHIITTMISQVDPETDTSNDILETDELRDQVMRRKVLLEKLIRRNHSFVNDGDAHYPLASQQVDEDYKLAGEPASGARGRIKPIRATPIEVIATKVRMFPKENEEGLVQAGLEPEVGRSRQRERFENETDPRSGLVLTDDTRRALAEFGSLFIKDTLGQSRESDSTTANHSAKIRTSDARVGSSQFNRAQSGARPDTARRGARDEPLPGSATERSFIASSMAQPTTRAPRDNRWMPAVGGQVPFHDRVNLFEPDLPAFGSSSDDRNPPGQHEHEYRNSHAYPSYPIDRIRSEPTPLPLPFQGHYHYTTGLLNRSHHMSQSRDRLTPDLGLMPTGQPSMPSPVPERHWSPTPSYMRPPVEQFSYPVRPSAYYGPQQAPHPNYHQGGPNSSGLGDYSGYDSPAHHPSQLHGLYLHQPPSHFSRPSSHLHQPRASHINQYAPDQYGHLAAHVTSPPTPGIYADYRKHAGEHSPASAEIYHHRQPHPYSHPMITNQPVHDSYIPTPIPADRYPSTNHHQQQQPASGNYFQEQPGSLPASSSHDRSDSQQTVTDYLKRVQFSDADRDRLMASYLTCDGLLNDNDHCLERLSCEFSDPQNIERANKLDRAVSSILLGHILINTYIPSHFKHRLKSASLFGYTQSGKCSHYTCNKLASSRFQAASSQPNDDGES